MKVTASLFRKGRYYTDERYVHQECTVAEAVAKAVETVVRQFECKQTGSAFGDDNELPITITIDRT